MRVKLFSSKLGSQTIADPRGAQLMDRAEETVMKMFKQWCGSAFLFTTVLWIRIGFTADPNPAI
jgi:hypothetical protein